MVQVQPPIEALFDKLSNRALLKKLWLILDDVANQTIVRWVDNQSFEIVDFAAFTRDVLPTHFKASKQPWGSFQRNLTGYYNFRRVEGHQLRFFHPLFLRNSPSLMLRMKRNPNTGNIKKTRDRALRRAAALQKAKKSHNAAENRKENIEKKIVENIAACKKRKEAVLSRKRTRAAQQAGCDTSPPRPQLVCDSKKTGDSRTPPRPVLKPPSTSPIGSTTVLDGPFSAAWLTPRLLGTGSTPREILDFALGLLSPQPQTARDLQAQSDAAFEEFMMDLIQPVCL
jgi:hypothetical protein